MHCTQLLTSNQMYPSSSLWPMSPVKYQPLRNGLESTVPSAWRYPRNSPGGHGSPSAHRMPIWPIFPTGSRSAFSLTMSTSKPEAVPPSVSDAAVNSATVTATVVLVCPRQAVRVVDHIHDLQGPGTGFPIEPCLVSIVGKFPTCPSNRTDRASKRRVLNLECVFNCTTLLGRIQ